MTPRHIKTLKGVLEYLELCDDISVTKENIIRLIKIVLDEFEAERRVSEFYRPAYDPCDEGDPYP